MRKRYVQTKRKMALREMENTISKKKKKKKKNLVLLLPSRYHSQEELEQESCLPFHLNQSIWQNCNE